MMKRLGDLYVPTRRASGICRFRRGARQGSIQRAPSASILSLNSDGRSSSRNAVEDDAVGASTWIGADSMVCSVISVCCVIPDVAARAIDLEELPWWKL